MAAEVSDEWQLRRYDDLAYPDDRRMLTRLLEQSAGFIPSAVLESTRSQTAHVVFAVQADVPDAPVAVTVFDSVDSTLKIAWMYVTYRQQHKGIGTMLLDEATREARRRGATTVTAFAVDAAVRFFTRFGFKRSRAEKYTYVRAVDAAAPVCPDIPAVDVAKLVFRRAEVVDKKDWCALVLDCCTYALGGYEMVQCTLDAEFRLVAVEATTGEIAGLVCVTTTGWVPFLASRGSYRQQGLGSLLLAAALEWLRHGGVESAALTPLSKRNVRYYQNRGFVLERPLSAKGRFEDNDLVMRRPIDPRTALLPPGIPRGTFKDAHLGNHSNAPGETSSSGSAGSARAGLTVGAKRPRGG